MQTGKSRLKHGQELSDCGAEGIPEHRGHGTECTHRVYYEGQKGIMKPVR